MQLTGLMQFSMMLTVKGIVSRDWEQMQWIPSDRSEECRVAGTYFFLFRWMPFSCINSKKHALAVYLWQLLCEWEVTIEDHSLLSVLYMYDSFFYRYVTPWMKNSSVMLLTGWLPPFFRLFCDRNSNFRLLDLPASEHWSLFIWETVKTCFFRIRT
jgi:hypothetical protein